VRFAEAVAVSLRESDGDFQRDFGRAAAQDGAQTRWEITGRQVIGGRFQLGEAPPTPGGKVRLLGLGLTARVGLEVRDMSQERRAEPEPRDEPERQPA